MTTKTGNEIVVDGDGRVYQYTLIRQHASSEKYGNCEVCGKFVTDVYSQRKEHLCGKETEFPGWAHDGYTFGHKDCLIGIRRRMKMTAKEDD